MDLLTALEQSQRQADESIAGALASRYAYLTGNHRAFVLAEQEKTGRRYAAAASATDNGAEAGSRSGDDAGRTSGSS